MIKVGLVGLGKIARTKHLPAIAANDRLDLIAIADPNVADPDVSSYRDIETMLAAEPAIDAVILCQPPQVRFDAARHALLAGKHVFLEKPPGTTAAEARSLVQIATDRQLSLFAAWHSREASAVCAARRALSGQQITAGAIQWKEDVRVWHPGQQWIWQDGGFGVFDPGINALSILTCLLDEPLEVRDAELHVPSNSTVPIAAKLTLATTSGVLIPAEFDFRQTGPQTWDIELSAGGHGIVLSHGGNRLSVDDVSHDVEAEAEYARLYERFLDLIVQGRCDVDLAPLRLVDDALRIGRRVATSPFDP